MLLAGVTPRMRVGATQLDCSFSHVHGTVTYITVHWSTVSQDRCITQSSVNDLLRQFNAEDL